MGRKRIPGIVWDEKCAVWAVDKVVGGERIRKRFGADLAEAESWLLTELERRNQDRLRGSRYVPRKFAEVAAHYLAGNQQKASIELDIYLLNTLMPYIGELPVDEIFQETLEPYISDRREAGLKCKTINLALGLVRHILNLCAGKYRDGKMSWLPTAPTITLLPLTDQRPPYVLSWDEQRRLLPKLSDYLARMALFAVNTGARDNVICNLRWDWEIPLEEHGFSVFVIPPEFVKGKKKDKMERIIVLNHVSQSIIESVRGHHPEYVFVYRRMTKGNPKKGEEPRVYRCHPVETINNTGWQTARKTAGLPDLHEHDLRHTFGARLREAGVGEETRADLMWHKRKGMPAHYSEAQIVEMRKAVELVTTEQHRNNRTLASIIREARAKREAAAESPKSHPEVKRVSGN